MLSRLRYWWYKKRHPLYYIDMSGMLLMEPPDPRIIVGQGVVDQIIRLAADGTDETAMQIVIEERISRA